MKGIERQYLRECVRALYEARAQLLKMTCKDAIARGMYGKSDTLSLDGFPEMLISDILREFDPLTPLLTEEIGSNVRLRATEEEVLYFCDPMDRSKVLAQFLGQYPEEKIGIIFQDERLVGDWERQCGGPVEISGPYGSITLVRQHDIIFNVMINYITGLIYIASDEAVGVLHADQIFEDESRRILKRTIDLVALLQPMLFPDPAGHVGPHADRLVAYCRDQRYEENLLASKIFGNKSIDEIRAKHLVEDRPGGPARILYLKEPTHAGFICSNGEKIGEWLGWLAYVKYLPQRLRAFEISFDSSWTRDQILMAPGPAYSILGEEIVEEAGRPVKLVNLNIAKLRYLHDPSRYRSTIVVCPSSNREVILRLAIQKSAELRFIA